MLKIDVMFIFFMNLHIRIFIYRLFIDCRHKKHILILNNYLL